MNEFNIEVERTTTSTMLIPVTAPTLEEAKVEAVKIAKDTPWTTGESSYKAAGDDQRYAETGWRVSDVLSRGKMTEEEARDFLRRHSAHIVDAVIAAAWEYMDLELTTEGVSLKSDDE
jgi:molybdenum cofactor biosynthesis enzyme MoaA